MQFLCCAMPCALQSPTHKHSAMPALSMPRLCAASRALALGHGVQLAQRPWLLPPQPCLPQGTELSAAPDIKPPFNIRFNLSHYTVGCLKVSGNKILTTKLSLNWQSGKWMPKACSLVSSKPTGASQESPPRCPCKAACSAHGCKDHSFFRYKPLLFFSPFFFWRGRYSKGIQMIHFIHLLELHAYR